MPVASIASIACMDPLPDPGKHSAQFLIESQPTCADGVRADNMYTLKSTRVVTRYCKANRSRKVYSGSNTAWGTDRLLVLSSTNEETEAHT